MLTSSLVDQSLQRCPAGLRGDVRSEWDELKQHDVMFLLRVAPPDEIAIADVRAAGREPTPADIYGLRRCRGCEIIEVCKVL